MGKGKKQVQASTKYMRTRVFRALLVVAAVPLIFFNATRGAGILVAIAAGVLSAIIQALIAD
jgi:hypothetical protein